MFCNDLYKRLLLCSDPWKVQIQEAHEQICYIKKFFIVIDSAVTVLSMSCPPTFCEHSYFSHIHFRHFTFFYNSHKIRDALRHLLCKLWSCACSPSKINVYVRHVFKVFHVLM